MLHPLLKSAMLNLNQVMFLFRDRNYSTIQLPNSEFIVPYKKLMNHKLLDDFDETEHLISPFWSAF